MCTKKSFKVSYNKPAWLPEELLEIGRERDIAFRYTRRKKCEASSNGAFPASKYMHGINYLR